MKWQKMKEGDRKAVEHLVNEHVNRALEALKKEIKRAGWRYRNKGESAFAVKAVLTAFR